MASLTGPLLSLTAHGTVAKTATYTRRNGENVARHRVVPANPRTAAQLHARQIYRWSVLLFEQLSGDNAAPWGMLRPNIYRNGLVRFLAAQTKALAGASVITGLVGPPRQNGGFPAGVISYSSAGGAVTIASNDSLFPPSWFFGGLDFFMVKQQDPSDGSPPSVVNFDFDTYPYNHTQGGLTPGDHYVIVGYTYAQNPKLRDAWGLVPTTTITVL